MSLHMESNTCLYADLPDVEEEDEDDDCGHTIDQSENGKSEKPICIKLSKRYSCQI